MFGLPPLLPVHPQVDVGPLQFAFEAFVGLQTTKEYSPLLIMGSISMGSTWKENMVSFFVLHYSYFDLMVLPLYLCSGLDMSIFVFEPCVPLRFVLP